MSRRQPRATQKRGSAWTINRLFAEALHHHQAGWLAEAERLYREVLVIEPRHAESLHLLGVAACQRGHYEQAIDLLGQAIGIGDDAPLFHYELGNAFKAGSRLKDAAACYRRAIDLEPTLADFHTALGVVLQEQGRRDEAMATYRQAIALRPDSAAAHNNLGNLLRDQGALEAAAVEYRQAVALAPDLADGHYNLGSVAESEGRLGEAAACYRQALTLKPDFAEAHNNLGNVLKAQGHLEDAALCYGQAIEVKPNYPEAFNNLGNILKDQGKLGEAVAHYRHAIVLRPDFAEAHNSLGTALQAQGLVDPAVAHYRRALAFKPDYAEAHYNLGVTLQDRGLLDEAAACYHQALALKPGFVEAYNNLGNILKEQGRLDEALARYEQALALRPDFAEVLFNRADIKTFRPGDVDLAALEALVADPHCPVPADKAPFLHFALAKVLEEAGEPARAFQHLLTGNALKRRQIAYDETAGQELFGRIKAVFDAGLLARHQGTGEPSTVPIFVLGMPRSGSSLIEQILASHPQVQGGGELTDMAVVATGVRAAGSRSAGYPEGIARLDGQELRRLGGAYLARLPELRAGKTHLTDKMPYNFLYIGLIRLSLPKARIIHTRRDPVDTCVSCFSKLFPRGQDYSYDLGELGRYYRAYDALMAHWHSVLPPDAIFDVSYEAVVNNLQAEAQRLIAYCGLPWDERCLDFHRTQQPVRTASAVQVRQPLFRTSLQRGRRYEAWLAPLLRELED